MSGFILRKTSHGYTLKNGRSYILTIGIFEIDMNWSETRKFYSYLYDMGLFQTISCGYTKLSIATIFVSGLIL